MKKDFYKHIIFDWNGTLLNDSEVAKALDIDCILVARGDQHKDTLLKTEYRVFDSLSEVLLYFKEEYNF